MPKTAGDYFFSVVVVLEVVLEELPGAPGGVLEVFDDVLSLGVVVVVVVLLVDEDGGDVADFPGSPFGPGAPGAPAGPGVADGAGTTVVFSQALSANTPATAATIIEYFIIISSSRMGRQNATIRRPT